jgi:exosome complex RNA-binding protein Rrp42 (RNase PH superfamily)
MNSLQASAKETKTILLTDPSRQEEGAIDGKITFSINAHK